MSGTMRMCRQHGIVFPKYATCEDCDAARGARTAWWCLAMLGHAVTVGVLAVWVNGTSRYNFDIFYDAKWVPEPVVAGVLRAALGDS